MQIDLEQKPKVFIVVNPVAGVTQPEAVREVIEAALTSREIPFEIYETKGDDNFRQIIRNAIQQGCKLVIAAGGDGTLSGVVDGLVDTQIPLLILPTGTWNALAQALEKLGRGDEARALAQSATSRGIVHTGLQKILR